VVRAVVIPQVLTNHVPGKEKLGRSS